MQKLQHFIASVALLLAVLISPLSSRSQGCGGIDFSASSTSGCAYFVVQFSASGATPGSSYTWDFGSGSIGGADTITKVFTTPGKYTVTLTVSNSSVGTCTVIKKDYIEVLATPKPKIGIVPGRIVCDVTQPVTFIDSTPGSVSREWVIDGVSYTNANPSITHKFTSSGTKSVTLKVTNSAGCSGIFSDNNYVTAYDPPTMDFCASILVGKTSVKANFSPNVSISGGRTIKTYQWDFPGASPSSYTGRFPAGIVWPDPKKSYDVTLTIITTDGCSYSLVRKSFIQRFIAVSRDSLCMGQMPFAISNLADNGLGRGFFNYKMSDVNLAFPPGSTSPNATYNNVGSFDFDYSFKYSGSGCETEVHIPGYVNVKGPKAVFFTPYRQVCDPFTHITLQNQSNAFGASNVKYTWYIFDENKNVIDKYGPISTASDTGFITGPDKATHYGVALVATSTNGCSDSNFQDKYITVSRPKADFSLDHQTICLGQPVKFTDQTTPPDPSNSIYRFTWIVTNVDTPGITVNLYGNSPNFKPIIPGRYTITQIVENAAACRDTMIKRNYLTVNGVLADININRRTGCVPMLTTATARIKFMYPNDPFYFNNFQFKWQADDPDAITVISPTTQSTGFLVNNTGCYTIYLNILDTKTNCSTQVSMDSAFCSGTLSSFNVGKTKCLGDTIPIYNTTRGRINNIKWLADPPTAKFIPSDTVFQPSIAFYQDTAYLVKFVCTRPTANDVCSDTNTHIVQMKLPHPNFSSPDTSYSCSPVIVHFDNLSENGVSFLWDFGDGQTQQTKNKTTISHVYQMNRDTGFSVTLTAIDTNGCIKTLTKQKYIHVHGPEPWFAIDKHVLCDSGVVSFVNQSLKTPSATIFFDDATPPQFFSNTSHFYGLATTGDSVYYYPVLIANDANGCKAFHKDSIRVYRSPKADFTADTAGRCAPVVATFHDKSRLARKWLWDFNSDGIIDDSVQNPVFVYDSAGDYNVTLTVINAAGCSNTVVKDSFIKVLPAPKPLFIPSSHLLCQEEAVSFVNKSRLFANFDFDYGDGSPHDSNVMQKHLYFYDVKKAVNGRMIFVPKLIAYNLSGCYRTYTDTLILYPRPVPGYSNTAPAGCAPWTVMFKDTSLYAIRREWDFNNDGIADDTSREVMHTFGAGFHTVRLKVYNTGGCKDSVIKVNVVYAQAQPIADFEVNMNDTDLCVGDTAHFTDLSHPAESIANRLWTFEEPAADYDTSSEKNPAFVFYTPGYHNVSLIVTDNMGCSDTVVKRSIYVEDQLPPQNEPIWYVTVLDTNQVKIEWDRSTLRDFANYTLYRGNTPVYSSDNIEKKVYNDIDPALSTNNSTYCYSLEITDKCGNISLPGDTSCTILLKAVPNGTAANLITWTPYIGWKKVQVYHLFRGENNSGYVEIATLPGTQLSYNDSGLCDETYCYYVLAANPDSSLFSHSNFGCAHPAYIQPTSATQLRVATVDDDGSVVRVNWDTTVYSGIKYYHIDRAAGPQSWMQDYAVTGGGVLIDRNVNTSKENYTYRVRMEDNCGYFSPYSNIGRSILLKTGITDDKIQLEWTPYADWANGVGQYLVQVRGRDKKFKTIKIVSGSTTSYLDDSVYSEIDTSWCYRIVAAENSLNPDTSISNTSCDILSSRIFVPNVFTPDNGDTLNEIWKAIAIGIYNQVSNDLLNFDIQVYNRWGEKVFESHDIKKGWNGTFEGKSVPEGVYVYRLHAEGIDGKVINMKGTLTLIR